MDSARFDTLTRALTTAGSRRRALAVLTGSLGLLGWQAVDDAAAHDPSKKCKKKSGQQKKKCLKKAKAHNATHTTQVPPPPPPPPRDPQGTCTTGQNFCQDGVSRCNASPFCFCFTTTTGATFCGGQGGGPSCADDAACTAVKGAGSACVAGSTPGNTNCSQGNVCYPPCPD